MNKTLISVVILFIAFSVSAQNEPTTDAIYQKIKKEYTLNEDGSIDFHYYKKMKYLTPYAFNRLYGETFIVYNPEFQELTINLSKTEQEDGTIIINPGNAFNEVLPRFAANAPTYNHLREMVVTHAGLEVNAVVELDFTIHTKPGYYSSLSGMETIKENNPVNEEIISFSIPENTNFNYKVLNIRTSPKLDTMDGRTIYQFTFSGLTSKAGSHESFTPSKGTDQPWIMYSTASMEDMYKSLTGQDAFQYKVDENMKEMITEVKKDVSDDIDLALKLQEIVANNINYYPVPLSHTGNKVRAAIDIFKSNGGTQLEKSVLLTALLRESGINAYPVFVSPTVFFDDGIGGIFPISEFLVQLNPREEKQLYLSATHTSSQNQIYHLAGKTVFALNPEKPLRIENIEEAENTIKLTGKLKFGDSLKFNGQIQLIISGEANPWFQIKKDSASIKNLLSGGVSANDISKFKILKMGQLRSETSFTVEKNSPIKNQKNYSFFRLPSCKQGIESWHMNYLTDARNSTLQVPGTISENYDITIQLPENVHLINPVEKTELQSGFGKLMIEISQNGNVVRIKKSIEISQKEIPVPEYKKFKEMMDLWNDKQNNELVFKSTY
jgi:hypothetical protein